MERLKKSKMGLLALLLLIAAALAAVFLPTGKSQQPFTSTEYAMGTYVQQTVYGKQAQDAAQAASKAVRTLESRISWRIDSSDVARLNAAAGTDWIDIEPDTAALLRDALDVAERSNGAFDPTVLPVSSLWDFGGDNQHLPGGEEIQKYLPYVGYHNLRVDADAASASLKIHGAALDLGGIGKGAACGEAVQAYQDAGAQAGIIAVGGSIGVYGEKPDGSLWRLAVRDPDSGEENAAELGTLDVAFGFVSTSGSYEKTFTEGGRAYHHLLDPKTGYPAESGLVSVTVVSDSGALSDALATAAFVLGKEQGMALLEEYGAGGILIDQEHRVTVSDSLKDAFRLTADAYTLAS